MHQLQVTIATDHDIPERALEEADDEMLDRLAFPPEWFVRPTDIVAPELIGTILIRRLSDGQLLAARIVETEAYNADDPASHSWCGPTQRNRAMFESGGCLYVYRIYGVHRCVNIVTGREGEGTAVLLRAAEPLAGIAIMRQRRGINAPIAKLLSGPANLARAFGFDLDDNCRRCTGEGIWVIPSRYQRKRIGISPRIGIVRAADALLRFFDLDSPAVSVHRRARCVL
ncbi:MAG: DNA-3-methyladenine glycosylase [Chlorobi bacterium]|nr:DNA-3-methyladenine glycosylase [Chlorobiota bacterium]